MKKGLLITLSIVGVIVLFLIILGIWSVNTYNGLVSQRENVTKTWSDVESQYQRRADLIPNLVSTVKGYADFEKEVLTKVTEARASVGQIRATPELVNDPQAFQKFQAIQGELSSALSRLMVTVEKYPDLKANEQFQNLQVQLEGTENRINVARIKFNDVAKDYNTRIKRFPAFIFANIAGFKEVQYFQAAPGTENVPKVEF